MFRRLLRLFKPRRSLLIVLFLATVIVGLLNVAQPALTGRLTATIFNGGYGLAISMGNGLGDTARTVADRSVLMVFVDTDASSPVPLADLRTTVGGLLGAYAELTWTTRPDGQFLRCTAKAAPIPVSLLDSDLPEQMAVSFPDVKIFGSWQGFETLIRKSGGLSATEKAAIEREVGVLAAERNLRSWSESGEDYTVYLLSQPGRTLDGNVISGELVDRIKDVAPELKLYPRLRVEEQTGWVLFPTVPTITLLPLLLLIVLLLRMGAIFCQYYLGVFIIGGTTRDLRNDLFQHLTGLSLGFFERKQTGQLMSRVTNDVVTLQTFLQSASVDMMADAFTTLLGIVFVFYLDWRLALITTAVIGVIAWPISMMGRALRRVGRVIQARWADLASVLQETIVGTRVIQAFQMEAALNRRFAVESETVFQSNLRGAKILGVMTPALEFLGGVALSGFIWFGASRVQQGLLLPDQLFTFVFVVAFISGPITRLSRVHGQLQQAMAAAERVFELLDTRPSVTDPPHAGTLPPVRGEVCFEDVCFSYGGPEILSCIDLTVRPGEILALVGPSGAGKSTLVNLIPRFYDPTAGRVLIDGRDLREVTLASLRAQLGIVPQETLLFRATVAENIEFGRPGASREEIIEAAKLANAHEFIRALPDGYDTLVGERGQTLSGGQRQRIAIARALLRNPRILILDEATSSLDAVSEAQVQAALDRLMEGRTTLVIAHRLSTVRRADRLAVLSEGRLVELGTHEELIARGGLYAHLYQQHQRGGEGCD